MGKAPPLWLLGQVLHEPPFLGRCVTSRFGVLVNMCVEVLHDVVDTTDEGVLYE